MPGLIVEMRYAGAHNFVGRPIDGYQAPHCLLTREAAEALAEVARDLAPRGLVIKVFDCYRPARAVANFVRWARDLNDQKAKAEFYPDVDKRTLFRDGYIASHSGHSRGSTIDLTLATRGRHASSTWARISTSSVRNHGPPTRAQRRSSTPTACCLPPRCAGAAFAAMIKEWWHFTLRGEPFPRPISIFRCVMFVAACRTVYAAQAEIGAAHYSPR